jgi:phage/plasmid-like protein (TIGR03299 family)
MSKESSEWLNQNTLIGFTSKRGNAWHYRASDQGAEPNHYEGAIPVPDVQRRLFAWEPVAVSNPGGIGTDGKVYTADDQVMYFHPETGDRLGTHGPGYVVHGYSDWLLDKISTILDADLSVGSAGLLKAGAVAWVQIEMAETMHHASGVSYRPFLTGATSLDGSLKTTYVSGNQVVVCDNTLSAALREQDASQVTISRKHTSRSGDVQLTTIRDALGLIVGTGDQFAAALDQLTSEKVDRKRMGRFMDLYVPVPKEEGRGRTLAEHKRDDLRTLLKDERVAPWNGTAWGVLQLTNTYDQHVSTIRGMNARAERNALAFLTGQSAKSDAETLKLLASV